MKHMVVVLTEPTEGNEKEFNDYYENVHLEEVIETTGWSSAQRFELSDEVGAKCPLPYLALYEAEADNPKEVIEKLNETRPQRIQSASINRRTAGIWVFSEIGPKQER